MMNGGDVNCVTDVFHEPGNTDGVLVFDFERHHIFLVDHWLEGILMISRQWLSSPLKVIHLGGECKWRSHITFRVPSVAGLPWLWAVGERAGIGEYWTAKRLSIVQDLQGEYRQEPQSNVLLQGSVHLSLAVIWKSVPYLNPWKHWWIERTLGFHLVFCPAVYICLWTHLQVPGTRLHEGRHSRSEALLWALASGSGEQGGLPTLACLHGLPLHWGFCWVPGS